VVVARVINAVLFQVLPLLGLTWAALTPALVHLAARSLTLPGLISPQHTP
jgi:hypothetical protein